MTRGGSGGVWGVGRSNRSGAWRHAALGIDGERTAHDILRLAGKETTHGALRIVEKRMAIRESNNKPNKYAVNVYKYTDDMQVVRRRRRTELVFTCFCYSGWKVLGAASSERNTRFPNLEGSHFGII